MNEPCYSSVQHTANINNNNNNIINNDHKVVIRDIIRMEKSTNDCRSKTHRRGVEVQKVVTKWAVQIVANPPSHLVLLQKVIVSSISIHGTIWGNVLVS